MNDEAGLEVLEGAAQGLITVWELLGFDEESADRLYDAALAYFEQGATARAEQVLGWLLSAKPFVARYWTAYGATLFAREAFVDAIVAYTKALAIDPDDVVARAQRGECCLVAGLTTRGIADLESLSASETAPELRPWVTRAESLLNLHNRAAALSAEASQGDHS